LGGTLFLWKKRRRQDIIKEDKIKGVISIATTKNQHYVSQGVLKHFCDEQKKIYELFIEKKLVSKKRIDNTMSQNYVYEHPRIETNTIEEIFANVEAKAFPLIDALIKEIESNYENETNIDKYIERIK
jgi:hypothetical protein